MNDRSSVRTLAIAFGLLVVLTGQSMAQGFWSDYKAAFGHVFLGQRNPVFEKHAVDRILTGGARASAAVGVAAGVAAGGVALAPIVAAKAPALITGGALLMGSANQPLPAQFMEGAGQFARGPTAQRVIEQMPRLIPAVAAAGK